MAARVIENIEQFKALEGTEVGVSDWFEISQSQIDRFAELTGDRQWIHTDPERAAKESPYKGTVAHGFLTLSLLSAMSHQIVQFGGELQRRINYGLNRVRFPAPAPAGCRVRGRFRLKRLEEIADGMQITWEAAVEVEGSEKPCLVAEWILRAYLSPGSRQ